MAKAKTKYVCSECGYEAAKWLGVNELESVDWLPADVEVVRAVKEWLET